MTKVTAARIDGTVAAGYEGVRDAFTANFVLRGELGAAFAAHVDGEVVVDLWGGTADPTCGAPWEHDTLQLIFSGTKGLVATAMLHMVDRGVLELEDPVAMHWPEFGSGGKDLTTIGDALAHRAGVPGISAALSTPRELLDQRAMAARVAREIPLWSDGTIAYHALTYGWIANELIWRLDGRTVGEYFAQEIADPLEAEAWIGLPAANEDRVGQLSVDESFRRAWRQAWGRDGLARIYGHLPLLDEPLVWNDAAFHRHEVPAANGIATARAMSAVYGCLACGGLWGERRLIREESIVKFVSERSRGIDALSGEWLAFGAGFALQTPFVPLGPPPDAFGHTGAGGSVHGAWPTLGTGFSYVMNEMRDELADKRARTLLASLYGAVANHRADGASSSQERVI